MSITGAWSLTVNSPMGAQRSTVNVTQDGGTLAGSSTGPQGTSTDIYEGKIEGDSCSFKIDITVPMPMTLAFEGKVTGDAVSGQVKAGGFGTFAFTGERA
jgi:hypothetical protein